MNSFEDFSTSEGLTSDSILRVIIQIESTEISTPLKFKLMAHLIPKQSIPEEAFIRMTCLLSDFQFDVKLKVEILKWMISVYSFVDNLDNFQDLIEVFFHLLENKTLRPYVCHLLHKMARKEHVTFKRMKRINHLREECEPEPFLSILLSSYCELVGKSIQPKEDIKLNFESLGIYPNLIKSVHPAYDIHIPMNYSLTCDESVPLPPFSIRVETSSKGLSKCQSANDKFSNAQPDVQYEFFIIYKEFESMRKPFKIRKILKNKFRRLFLATDISQREKNCLENYILNSMYFNLGNTDFLCDTLEVFRNMQQVKVPRVSYITEEFIEHWDGSSGLDAVIELLSYEPLCCFEKIGYKLDLIFKKFLHASVFEKCDFINGLSKLYEHWVLSMFKNDSVEPSPNYIDSFSDDCLLTENHEVACQIHLLGNYIGEICDAYLLDNNFHPCLLNEILHHYERVSRCHIFVKNLVLHPPTTTIFHAALFSLNLVTLDSLCSLMIRYDEEIKIMRINQNPESDLADVYFKRYRNDILCLLLQREFESNASTHLSMANVIQELKRVFPNFKMYFDLCKHPALIQETASFIEYSGEDISCSRISEIPDIRTDFLNYLGKNGQQCLVDFLNLFMNYRKQKARKAR